MATVPALGQGKSNSNMHNSKANNNHITNHNFPCLSLLLSPSIEPDITYITEKVLAHSRTLFSATSQTPV